MSNFFSVLLIAACVFLTFIIFLEYEESHQFSDDGLRVIVDPETKCEYLTIDNARLIPRMVRAGQITISVVHKCG